MTGIEIPLLFLAVVNVAFSIVLYAYVVSINKSTTPLCLSWLDKGILSISLSAIVTILILIKKDMMLLPLAEYLFMNAIYLYALWQTKFSLIMSKTMQKLYIMLINFLICSLCIKYVRLFTTQFILVNDNIPDASKAMIIPMVIGCVFLTIYIIYNVRNRSYEKQKFKPIIYTLEWMLGIIVLFNVVQTIPEVLISIRSGLSSETYYEFFKLDMIIRYFMNLLYMIFMGIQVIYYKGRYIDD